MSSSPPKNFLSLPQPSFVWLQILGFAAISVALVFVGAGNLLTLFFPMAAFFVGVYLYFRAPVIYVGFVWWLWFLTPLVRRLSDWSSRSYTEPSPILVTPFLVTLISTITLIKHLPKVHRQGGVPFLLSVIAIIYGVSVGYIYRDPIALIINGLDWFVPVVFGFHLFVNWRNYPAYRQNIQRVFLWGVIIMGVYGVYQFCVSPPWDAYWLIKSGFNTGSTTNVVTSANVPKFSINVWSTLSSNRPFGTVMMAGLILLLVNESKGKLAPIASIAGYLSFLLARKRTTWLSWLIAIFFLLTSLKPKTQKRIITGMILLALMLIPLSSIDPFSEAIFSRFSTISELESDNSGSKRLETFSTLIGRALTSVFGQGIGGPSYDSGIISTLLDIGWLGTIFYTCGLALLFFSLFQNSKVFSDPFISAARAISVSVFMQIPLGRSHVEVQGLILWGFLGIALAGQKYHRYRRSGAGLQNDVSHFTSRKLPSSRSVEVFSK